MSCAHCGQTLPEHCRFCPACGRAVSTTKAGAGAVVRAQTGEPIGFRGVSSPASIKWTDEERLGATSRCHLCNRPRSPNGKYYEFGLGKELRLNWRALSLAMLVGFIGVQIRAPLRVGQIVRLRLALCDRCARSKRVWGTWLAEFSSIRQSDCRSHPWWIELETRGYQRYLSGWQMRGYPGE